MKENEYNERTLMGEKTENVGPAEQAEEEDEKSPTRLWIAVCQKKDVGRCIIEYKSVLDLRAQLLDDPDILDVESVYRGFKKEFTIEVVRKIII